MCCLLDIIFIVITLFFSTYSSKEMKILGSVMSIMCYQVTHRINRNTYGISWNGPSAVLNAAVVQW